MSPAFETILSAYNCSSYRRTFEHGRTLKEQLEALTSYQLNKTSRDPSTLAYYQHLQVVSIKV